MDLSLRVSDIQLSISHLHRHLLVGAMEVDVGITCRFHHDRGDGIDDHEICLEHHLIVVVLIIDGHSVVSAHLQPALLVGYLQVVMGVKHVGIERLFHVINGLSVVKAIDIVAGEDVFRQCPVSLAMFHLIYISVVFVGEVVKIDVDRCLLM